MIYPVDITSETVDITATWCALTGEVGTSATAHFRGGSITVVAVQRTREALPPALMCRNGAAAIMSDAVVTAFETRARRRLQ
ncbi:hypothetical protein [Paracoccus beibuensis]|uniref:hypothetical protein n=1 Tax=Paracoccus beibuensis TaxID=547602 RepID=UPI002240272E|nr:hypothetical protein [Paracoccus beibuensis]